MIWAGLVRAGLCLLFATAGFAKLSRIGSFQAALRNYRIFPTASVKLVAIATPAVELAASAALLLGLAPTAALLVSAALLLAFAISVALSLRKGGPRDCGCLGELLRIRADWSSVGTNVALAIVAAAAVTQRMPSLPLPHPEAASGTTALVTWLSASLLVMAYWLLGYGRGVRQMVNDATDRGQA
jgi:uncharacterized membrane protein YphA (DoxX/SURF4 family)